MITHSYKMCSFYTYWLQSFAMLQGIFMLNWTLHLGIFLQQNVSLSTCSRGSVFVRSQECERLSTIIPSYSVSVFNLLFQGGLANSLQLAYINDRVHVLVFITTNLPQELFENDFQRENHFPAVVFCKFVKTILIFVITWMITVLKILLSETDGQLVSVDATLSVKKQNLQNIFISFYCSYLSLLLWGCVKYLQFTDMERNLWDTLYQWPS